jgi:tripartite-type tricarboxylate transporter receptor subunit TctC
MTNTGTMKLVHTMLAAALFAGLSGTVPAQDYPNKPIRYIVPFAPGGMTDILGRVFGQKLSEAWGQQVIVDNRAGAAGGVGSEIAAKSKPDGYTILGGTISSHAINVSLYSKLPYDPVRDFAPITLYVSLPNMLVVHPSLPVRSVRDLISLAKAKPSQLTFASAGSGTSQHLSGELFNVLAGVKLVHVPYKGSGPGLADLMGGQVMMFFDNITTSLPLAKADKIRAIAVTTAKRASVMPELPTIAESGLAAYDVSSWQGVFAPAGTPKEIVAKLNTEIRRILALPDVRERLTQLGADPAGNTPEQFGAYVKAEIAKWGPIVKASGARVD